MYLPVFDTVYLHVHIFFEDHDNCIIYTCNIYTQPNRTHLQYTPFFFMIYHIYLFSFPQPQVQSWLMPVTFTLYTFSL